MIHFMVKRWQWIIRLCPWYIETTEDDGLTYYRLFRQWRFSRHAFGNAPYIYRVYSFGPIEIRIFPFIPPAPGNT